MGTMVRPSVIIAEGLKLRSSPSIRILGSDAAWASKAKASVTTAVSNNKKQILSLLIKITSA